MKASIADIVEQFPDTRIAFLVADDLDVSESRPEGLSDAVAEAEAACRSAYTREAVGQIPGVAVWREAYKGFGVKKTSYRSSVERLLRNVLADKPLATINALVDCYNRVSVKHVMPAGADDLALVSGDICFRIARDNDSFIPLGETDENPPKQDEVVYADGAKVLCRRWNWYQDARSAVTASTKRAVLTIQAQGEGDIHAAVADLTRDIETFCGGRVVAAVTDRYTPTVEL
ncbi:MAG: B3/4 domain-containing protein [Minwuia sp.]|uniref:B3/B4 domain-containing protein n=1 Tax=Minwuia sp. TaxID=2493630 RepID=UPI003A8B844A